MDSSLEAFAKKLDLEDLILKMRLADLSEDQIRYFIFCRYTDLLTELKRDMLDKLLEHHFEQLRSKEDELSTIDKVGKFILGCDAIKNDDCWFYDS